MNSKLQAWREAGKHLPAILKDFHYQKEIFNTMHTMLGEPDPKDMIKRPSWIEGHCYVIDCFLWFMARHGYTLQRSRSKLEFDSLEDNVKAVTDRKSAMFAKILSNMTIESKQESED